MSTPVGVTALHLTTAYCYRLKTDTAVLNGPLLIVYQKGVLLHYYTNRAAHYAQRKQIGPLPGPGAPQCAASPCGTRYTLHPERTLNKSSHLLSYCAGVLPDQHTGPRGRNDRRRAYARVLAVRVLRAILAAPAQPRASACACVRVRAGAWGRTRELLLECPSRNSAANLARVPMQPIGDIWEMQPIADI